MAAFYRNSIEINLTLGTLACNMQLHAVDQYKALVWEIDKPFSIFSDTWDQSI